jgi:hypothetical protein
MNELIIKDFISEILDNIKKIPQADKKAGIEFTKNTLNTVEYELINFSIELVLSKSSIDFASLNKNNVKSIMSGEKILSHIKNIDSIHDDINIIKY